MKNAWCDELDVMNYELLKLNSIELMSSTSYEVTKQMESSSYICMLPERWERVEMDNTLYKT